VVERGSASSFEERSSISAHAVQCNANSKDKINVLKATQ
jgi:hypothetical protein